MTCGAGACDAGDGRALCDLLTCTGRSWAAEELCVWTAGDDEAEPADHGAGQRYILCSHLLLISHVGPGAV